MTTDLKIINLPNNPENRGFLTYIEEGFHIPFKIESSWLLSFFQSFNTKLFNEGQDLFFICLKGKLLFQEITENNEKGEFILGNPSEGLLKRKNAKMKVSCIESNSVCLVLNDAKYTSKKIDINPTPKLRLINNWKKIALNSQKIGLLDGFYIESKSSFHFEIKRVFYMYGIKDTKTRGNHAHTNGYQLITAPYGSFNLNLDSGGTKQKVFLNNPSIGILVGPGVWRELSNFSPDSVCLVFCSLTYQENKTIRNYQEFIDYKKF